MQSYSKLRTGNEFNWNVFLDKSTWSDEEIESAKLKASNWVTCAVGRQCDDIPRDPFGTPNDKELFQLGVNFSFSMEKFTGDTANLKYILAQIEIRSAEILASIGK